MVPTVDTLRYDFLIHNLLVFGRPVLMVGPVGTGKTSVAQGVLQKLDTQKYNFLTINLSAQVYELHVLQVHVHVHVHVCNKCILQYTCTCTCTSQSVHVHRMVLYFPIHLVKNTITTFEKVIYITCILYIIYMYMYMYRVLCILITGLVGFVLDFI